MKRARFLLASAMAVALPACDSATDPDGPVVVGVSLPPSATPVQPMRVTLERALAAPLVVEYWADDGPRLRVESASTSLVHDLALLRLRPDRTYRYEIVGTDVDGVFRTPALPADLAAIGFDAQGDGTSPLVLVHLFDPGFRGYAIVDEAGEVVWYRRTTDFPYGATRRANGNFVFMERGAGLAEVTPAGEVVRTLPPQPPDMEQHHDVIATSRGTLLYLAFDPRPFEGRTLLGESIREWTPETGQDVRRWSSWDHFSPVADRGARFGHEWMHANSLAIGTRGNILVGIHYWDQVISLAPDFTAVEWRLGGTNATIPVAAADAFSGQHTPEETANGGLLIFDNAIAAGGPSRAIELEVVAGSARRRWAWTSPAGNYASAVSSARRLEGGNTLVAFGMAAGISGSTGPTEVFEVTPSGTVAWHLIVSGTNAMFRAEPLSSVGGEREVR